MLEKACKFNRFDYSFVETKEECLKLVSELIHENDVVSVGGSVTLNACGIIEYLEKTDRLYSLPQELLTAALLRRDNPDATLKELCRVSTEPLTVSGLNHRLNKIITIYENNKQ